MSAIANLHRTEPEIARTAWPDLPQLQPTIGSPMFDIR